MNVQPPEASDNVQGRRPGSIGNSLWRRPNRWFLFGIPIGGFVAFVIGIIFWVGFETTVHATSTTEFCISCHEMEEFVYEEFKTSIHNSNRSGVMAGCKDCHIPKEFFPKMRRKIYAGLVEVPGHILGRIDTREKYEAHKLEMAERVWKHMRATDSRECRNCHSYEAMSTELQGRQAQRRHSAEYREETGKTCIDCHQGVAHSLPEMPDVEE